MSDSNDSTKFGTPAAETKKNPKVFNLRVKIEPYTNTRPPEAKRAKKEEKFDPFGVVFKPPDID